MTVNLYFIRHLQLVMVVNVLQNNSHILEMSVFKGIEIIFNSQKSRFKYSTQRGFQVSMEPLIPTFLLEGLTGEIQNKYKLWPK